MEYYIFFKYDFDDVDKNGQSAIKKNFLQVI